MTDTFNSCTPESGTHQVHLMNFNQNEQKDSFYWKHLKNRLVVCWRSTVGTLWVCSYIFHPGQCPVKAVSTTEVRMGGWHLYKAGKRPNLFILSSHDPQWLRVGPLTCCKIVYLLRWSWCKAFEEHYLKLSDCKCRHCHGVLIYLKFYVGFNQHHPDDKARALI